MVKSKGELEDRERKHKKNKNKDKDRKKHKKRRLDNSGDVDKTYENVTNGSKTVQLKEQPDMVDTLLVFISHLWIACLDHYPSLIDISQQ